MRTTTVFAAAAALAAVAFAAAPASAQAPNELNFQGKLTDASGNPITAATGITFRIFNVATGGTALWTEARTGGNAVTPNANGVYSVRLGSITAFPGTLTFGGTYFLELQVGADAPMTPRYQMTSAPYSLRSARLGSLTDAGLAGTVTDANLGTLTAGGSSNADLLHTHALSALSGTLADSQLSANIARLNVAQSWSAGQTFASAATFSAAPLFTASTGAPFSVGTNSTLVTNLNADQLDGLDSAAFLRSNLSSSVLSGVTLTVASGATLNIAGGWQIAGSAVTASATGLNTVTGGSTTNADSFHTHALSALSGSVTTGQLPASVVLNNAPTTISATYTFATAPSFSPATGAPFSVGNANLVTNLNAQFLGGNAASFFLDTSGTGQTKSGALTVGGLTVTAATSLQLNSNMALNLVAENITADPAGPQPEGRMIWRSDQNLLKMWDTTTSAWFTVGGAGAGVNSLNGLVGALTIAGANGNTVSAAGSTVTVTAPTVAAGTGVSVSFAANTWTVTNTGDTNAADDITTSTAAAGDLSGTYPSPTVDGLQTRPVSATAPASGDVLKWNGSAWAPALDATGSTYTAGTNITIVSGVISVSPQGSTSSLNADLLDSLDSAAFLRSNTTTNFTAGTLTTNAGTTFNIAGTWQIGGIATSANVTATNLNTLTGGTDASALHTHSILVHSHYGATWTGATNPGLYVQNTGTGNAVRAETADPAGYAVFAVNTDTLAAAGNPIAVYGNAAHSAGWGVLGSVGATSGATSRGVFGRSQNAGVGVYGETVTGIGGRFDATGATGVGGRFTASGGGIALDIAGTWQISGTTVTATAANLNTVTNGSDASVGPLHTHSAYSTTAHTHTAAGDVTGALATTLVVGLRGFGVSATAPSGAGDVLRFNGTQWAPSSGGAGSNINADALDGLTSTDFMRSNANTTWGNAAAAGTLAIGDSTLGADTITFNAGNNVSFANAAGTAPFTVVSSTLVANLNAAFLSGNTAGSFLDTSATAQTKTGGLTVGPLSVSGASTFTVGTGASTLGGSLGVTGATTLSGSLVVGGVSNFNNTLNANGGVSILEGGAPQVDYATVVSAPLAAARTITLPDATGTVITTGNLSAITATGTVASGTWNGTPIGAAYGGTGINTSAAVLGSIFRTTGLGTWSTLAPGAANDVLTISGGTPTWQPGSAHSHDAQYINQTASDSWGSTGAGILTLGDNTGGQDIIRVQFGGELNLDNGVLRILGSVAGAYSVLTSTATVSRSFIMPDAGGTVITTGNLTAITATGTVTSGTWNAGIIQPAYGGTGLNTSATTAGSLLRRNAAATAWETLGIGVANDVLAVSGGVPTWVSASSTHNHFNQSWSGVAGSFGLDVNNGSAAGDAIQGRVTGGAGTAGSGIRGIVPTGNNGPGSGVFGQYLPVVGAGYGVRGECTSPAGFGIYGVNLDTGATAQTIGVRGEARNDGGSGVYGINTNTTAAIQAGQIPPHGVFGTASHASGVGILGSVGGRLAAGVAGLSGAAGVAAQQDIPIGVYGEQTGTGLAAADGDAGFGVFGQANDPIAVGVYGDQAATSGAGAGVRGVTASSAGYGVQGYNSDTTGLLGSSIGVYGSTAYSGGWGVYGVGGGSGIGVYGFDTGGWGVFGNVSTGNGVRGRAGAASGIGGYFENSAGGVALEVGAGTFQIGGSAWTTGATGANLSILTGGATSNAQSLHTHGNKWDILGNAGTVDGTNFIGTTDGVALSFRVNNVRALRLEPNATSPNFIGGHPNNSVAAGVVGATVSGGGNALTPNSVTANYGTVGGGLNNSATVANNTVGGGSGNACGGAGNNVIAGGVSNAITAGNNQSIVGGLGHALSGGGGGFIGGGDFQTINAFVYGTISGGNSNLVTDSNCTIGGGNNNQAGDNAGTNSDRPYATVGGGSNNIATGQSSTVGGGENNQATSFWSTAAGGLRSFATGNNSAVGGGQDNTASGTFATVPGGVNNSATNTYAFAAGNRAKANHLGSFVWGDGTGTDLLSSAANEWTARCSGGVRFYSNGTLTAGVTLATGANAWAAVSDRNLKENFEAVTAREILDRLSVIPMSTWNYKSESPSIRHMGPMAQDFYAAFRIGEDERHIVTIDADGVALAAIQGLYSVVKEKDAKIAALEARLSAIEARLAGSSVEAK